jgi:uncharacterized membrane protein
MPAWILTLLYWLHLLATIVWIGGLAMLTLVIWPGLAAAGDQATPILDRIEARFRPLANVSLALLIATGVVQMGDDPHYVGFLVINSAWALGLLIKHIVVGSMVITSWWMQTSLQPELARLRLAAHSSETEATRRLRRRLRSLTVLNMALGVLVLLTTAWMTSQA